MAFTVVILFFGSAVAPPVAFANSGGAGSNSWGGYVATHPTDCEFIRQTIQQGNAFQPGNPRIDTYASVDGPQGCANTGFMARPGSLSWRQDLWYWFDRGQTYLTCNFGPRIANDGYWTHAGTTGYGFNVGGAAVCGNTWYVPLSYNYYNTFPGGPWNGGTVAGADLYVWTQP